jgi:hypothetical protein
LDISLPANAEGESVPVYQVNNGVILGFSVVDACRVQVFPHPLSDDQGNSEELPEFASDHGRIRAVLINGLDHFQVDHFYVRLNSDDPH